MFNTIKNGFKCGINTAVFTCAFYVGAKLALKCGDFLSTKATELLKEATAYLEKKGD